MPKKDNRAEARSRRLTDGEDMVLGLVQAHYGSWNTADCVFFSEQDEAVIFVKDAGGESVICVNLTVCASAYSDGVLSFKKLKSDWLQIPDAQ